MKIDVKSHFLKVVIVLVVFGCGQTTTNKGNQMDIDSSGNNSVKSNNSNVSAPPSLQGCKNLDGSIFRYKYKEEDTEDLTFTIMFHCKNDSLQGLMFGPEPEGDDGMYYFKSNLDNLKLTNDSLSFQFAYGDLYQKPFTLENYNKDFSNKVLGGDNGVMYYTGKLSGDSIVFTCQSPSLLCYDDVMVFKKK